MKRMFLLLALMPMVLSAALLTVDDDGGMDYTLVQQAIDATADGDTVLVYPGAYYEHLDFLGKAISVMSLAITTGDTAYVSQTVLDGEWSGCVVKIVESPNAFLGGFTVTHGLHEGTEYATLFTGGGVFTRNSVAGISCCYIVDNFSRGAGGGIYLLNSLVTLSGNIVKLNTSCSAGGGIALVYYPSVDPLYQTSCEFDSVIMNSVYCNSSPKGNDIAISRCDSVRIALECFTAPEADSVFVFLYESTLNMFEINDYMVEPVEADLYVSADGSDNNGGLSPDDPLRTMSRAMMKIRADSLHLRTVHVADGYYSHSATNELLPVHLRKNVSLIGGDDTQVDGEGRYPFYLHDECTGDDLYIRYGSIAVANFRLTNGVPRYNASLLYLRNLESAYISNIYVDDIILTANESDTPELVGTETCNNVSLSNIRTTEYPVSGGVGSSFFYNASIDRIYVSDSELGAALFFTHTITPSHAVLSNSLISGCENTDPWPGAIIWSGLGIQGAYYEVDPDSMTVKVINCTIADNTALNAAVLVSDRVSAEFYNTIVAGNDPNVVALDGRYNPGSAYFSHCLLDGGEDDIVEYGTQYDWDTAFLLSGDPLFLGGGDTPYALSAWSPAINAGTTGIPGYTFPLDAVDLAGNPRVVDGAIDLGCYEYQGTAVQEVSKPQQPRVQAWPNPVCLRKRSSFYCSFSVSLPRSGDMELSLYNIRGQKVRTLGKGYLCAGEQTMQWNGCDDTGRKVGAGVYLYHLTTSDGEASGRVTVVK